MFSAPPVQKVSVVIPVYNEQESLPELIRRTTAACDTMGKAYEILLVDDGSSDNSALMMTEAAQAEGSHIVAVLLNRNYGQHSAIMAGFSHVTGDLIITPTRTCKTRRKRSRAWWPKPTKAMTWSARSVRTVRTACSASWPRAPSTV